MFCNFQQLLSEAGNGWKRGRGVQSVAWPKGMKTLISGLTRVVLGRLPGWSSRHAHSLHGGCRY